MKIHTSFLLSLILLSLLAACTTVTPTLVTSSPTLAGPTITPSPTAIPETPVPLAVSVNGQGITLAEFQAELDTYLSLQATQPPDTAAARQKVLDMLIDRALLAQAAQQDSFQMSQADLQARVARLVSQLGNEQALNDWQAKHGYTQESFLAALRVEAAAAYERDRIAAQVSATADQVHVRQILVTDQASVNTVLGKLRSGLEFATLAVKYDPVTGGDLGWFPKDYLPDPKISDAAFALQPGEVSEPIQTDTGFHILQLIERDPQHPLNPDQRLILQQAAIRKWLTDQRAASHIEVMLPK